MVGRIAWLAMAVWMVALPVWATGGFRDRAGPGYQDKHLHDPSHPDAHGVVHARAEVEKLAPNFVLRDLEGKVHMLFKQRGKIVVLEWTDPTCPAVKRHQAQDKTMPATYEKFKDEDVVWLAIDSSHSCEESAGKTRAWAKQHELSHPILLDASGKIGRIYGVRSAPHIFVIDKQGVLAYGGAVDDDPSGDKKVGKRNYVEEALVALLAGSPVAVPSTDAYGCPVKYKE